MGICVSMRCYALLRREGGRVNHKKVYRLYVEENLALRLKRRKEISGRPRKNRPVPHKANKRWSMDCMTDALLDGRTFRILNVVDDATREYVAAEVTRSYPSLRVIRCLTRALDARGAPESIVVDNGTEFTAKAMDRWADTNDVTLEFTRPGHPIDNAFIESFNGKFRDECCISTGLKA